MTVPISGPFFRTQLAYGPTTSLGFTPEHKNRKSTWYRQKRPYTLPLIYELDDRRVVGKYYDPFFTKSASRYHSTSNVPYWIDANLDTQAYNKAYDRFVAKLKDPVLMATNIHERKQAFEMMNGRITQLSRFARALRRGRLDEAAKVLNLRGGASMDEIRRKNGQNQKRSLKQNAQGFGNTFLEFHFGWVPIVKDIYGTVEILQKGIPPMKVMASCTVRQKWTYDSPVSGSGNGATWSRTLGDEACKHRIQAEVWVSNPNLWLANQLGLVNPAAIVWESIPFSFVVDWIANVGKFLESFTDFWGLTLVNPQRGFRYIRIDNTWEQTWTTAMTPPQWRGSAWWNTSRVWVKRTPGTIPGPTLKLYPLKGLSPTRSAVAVALLLQQLGK